MDHELLNLTKLNRLPFTNPEQYIAAFGNSANQISKVCLNSFVVYFLDILQEDFRREVHPNESNLQSLKALNKSFMPIIMFRDIGSLGIAEVPVL
jgi:hypothetical protein